VQVAELCRRLGVPYRHVRYVLEEGVLPRGVAENPGRGEHRDLDPGQAFWLGIVLKLKQSGVTTTLAAKIADYTKLAVRGITQNMNWEWPFNPFQGQLKTENEWYVDIGDLTYIRLVTGAMMTNNRPYVFPWAEFGKHKPAEGVAPVVIIRVDLSCLARLLSQ
jgi:hypothetical protein